MVDRFGIGLIGPKSEGLICNQSSHVEVNLLSQLTQRYQELLVVTCGHFGAHLSHSCGRNHVDKVNRIVVIVSLEH